MDSFESVVATVLERDGYWVRSGLKVDLTKDDKERIKRPSCPRWELDIVGYRGASNELVVVECKSYLDSPGVTFAALTGTDKKGAKRYKLFNDPSLRDVVFSRLKFQLREAQACRADPAVRFGLAAGKVAGESDRDALRAHFKKQDWLFWDDRWLRDALGRVANGGYDNQVAAVVAKLLLRPASPAAGGPGKR